MPTYALKAFTGPCAVKEYATKLRAIAGLESVSEGTENVYFTVSDELTHFDAMTHAQSMIRFAGIKGLTVLKV